MEFWLHIRKKILSGISNQWKKYKLNNGINKKLNETYQISNFEVRIFVSFFLNLENESFIGLTKNVDQSNSLFLSFKLVLRS